MRARQILCPACGTVLDVPPGKADCFVRCGNCRHRFRLPKRIAVTDDAITDWLVEGRTPEEDKHAAERRLRPQEEAASSAGTAVLPAISDAIRLVKSDAAGALFEFPAARLSDPAFRCAMPRRCVRCGAPSHLVAHVIVYATHLMDGSFASSQAAWGDLVLRGEGVGEMPNAELLERLPVVPNVPAPADKPMPFWLCDMCTVGDLISGQIRSGGESVGLCRLWIGSLRRAEEFLVAAGGRDSPGHAELRHRIASLVDDPWAALPLAVQNRIHQWYRPQPGEHFVAYIADRERARSEEGLAGIVVTDRRVIYHTSVRHKEAGQSEKFELTETVESGRAWLDVRCSSWDVKHVAVDRDGLGRLRSALTRGRFAAVWH
ncbi:MAG: zinc-ribbon domain-containing protein [Phycisphaerae bacterium]|nr:zinc-ribbon domain-containing protein [Phycisphaerae bacterium]